MGLIVTVAGLLGLTLFGWLVWPPLALLPLSIAAVLVGLLVDWEALRDGNTARPPPR